MGKNLVYYVALVLVVIGGLNWGLFAFGYDIIEMLLGFGAFAKTVYALIALSALYMIYSSVEN
jgi:uncharacterized protein